MTEINEKRGERSHSNAGMTDSKKHSRKGEVEVGSQERKNKQ